MQTSLIQNQTWESNSQNATVLTNTSLYNDALAFATKVIRFEKINISPVDVVHDLIIETDLSYINFMNKIRTKVKNEKQVLITVNIDNLDWKRTLPFKTNIDFTCTICKNIYPECEQRQWFSSKGFYVIRNTCKECNRKQKAAFERKACAEKSDYWLRKLIRQKQYYQKNRDFLLQKRKLEYLVQHNISNVRTKIDWLVEKQNLTDRYIRKLLRKKHLAATITQEMIIKKRKMILSPKTLKPKSESKAAWNIKRKEKYKNDVEYRQKIKDQVSIYSKNNREKRNKNRRKNSVLKKLD